MGKQLMSSHHDKISLLETRVSLSDAEMMVADAIFAKTQENVYEESSKYSAVIRVISSEMVRRGFTEEEAKDACRNYVFDEKQFGGRIEPNSFFNVEKVELHDYSWYCDRVAEGYRDFDVYVPDDGGKALFKLKDGRDVRIKGYTKK